MSQVPSMVGLGAESLPRTVSDGFSPHGSASQPGSLRGSKNAQLLGLMRAGSAESGSPSDTGSKSGVRMSPNDCALSALCSSSHVLNAKMRNVPIPKACI